MQWDCLILQAWNAVLRKWSFKELGKELTYSFLCGDTQTSKATQSAAWRSEVSCERYLQV